MSSTPSTLSVIVPAHGRTDLFLETLASLERQTLRHFELIVTDDSVEAGDRDVIRDATITWGDRTGRPARYLFSVPRLGQARNTNQGLARATGTLLRILHSDDVLAPRTLEAEAALFDDDRLGMQLLFHHPEAFVRAPRFDRQPALSLLQPSLLFQAMLHSATPLPSATVFTREALDAVGGMREDLDFLCDWEFFARLLIREHRAHRFIGNLTAGFIGWRVHPDSTTGRLWHRHFLEHEQFMADLRAQPALCESLIGDRYAREVFFAHAVRYRYRRLREDVRGMPFRRVLASSGRIARCALSRASIRERLRVAPWRRRTLQDFPDLVVSSDASLVPADASRPPQFVEPRTGWRFVASAYASAAIIRWGKAYVARHGGTSGILDASAPGASGAAQSGGPSIVEIGRRIDIRPQFDGTMPTPGEVLVLTEYNNTTNLWFLCKLLAGAGAVGIKGLNVNAYAEPVLHQLLKLVPVGAVADVSIVDNHHLTAFGFKALIEKLFPQQFTWIEQIRHGATQHVLRYRRTAPAHPAYSAPHTGWTFGMLTTGTRLANVVRFVESIEQHCREPYEILIVSPVDLGEIAARPHVRVLRFAERDELGWITRKKNLIAAEAQYSDILICHDRFWLAPSFTADFSHWGYAYGLAAMRVELPDGSRGLDWAVVSSQNHVWSNGGLLDYRACSQYAYNPGGATLIRKAFWQDFPWNENLFWNEHEDVELCRRVQRAGGVISLAQATLMAAEDRWVHANPRIPYCDQNEVLYGRPVGEQRIRFLPTSRAA